MRLSFYFCLAILFISQVTWAAAPPAELTYHGRILHSDNSPLSGTFLFRIQIRTPSPSNCLMYEEERNVIVAPNGAFSIGIHDGSVSRSDSGLYSFDEIFSNRSPFTFSLATCGMGASFTPEETSARQIVVMFSDGGTWEALPAMKTAFAPQALEAVHVGGYGSGDLLRVDKTSSQTVNPLTFVDYGKLVDLIAGKLNGANLPSMTTGQVLGSNGSGGWQAVTPLTAASIPNCAAGEYLRGSAGTLVCATVTGGGSGLTSLNGQTGATQTFAVGTGGTAPAFNSVSNTHTLNIPLASSASVTAGLLSKTDYDSFASRQPAGNYVTTLTGDITSAGFSAGSVTTSITNGVVTDAKIADVGVDKITSAVGKYLTYAPNGSPCTNGQVLKWNMTNTRWECAGDAGIGSETDPTVQAFAKNAPSTEFTTPSGILTLSTVGVAKGGTGLATLGSAHQLLGVNTGATGLEYKSLTAGSGVTITPGAGTLTIAATGSGGSVTSLGISVPSYMTSTGGPITSSGTIALDFGTQAANMVFAGPTSATAAPGFRVLNIADIKSTSTGNFFGASGACSAGQVLTYSSVSDQITCAAFSLTSSQVTSALSYTPVNKAGDTMTGAINMNGQSILGSSTANGTLTLDSTSNASKGNILLNPTGGNVGFGTTTPAGAFDAQGTRVGVGTVSGAGTLTGTGTFFTRDISVGDVITYGGAEERHVISIASDTSLTLNRPFTNTLSSSGYSIRKRMALNAGSVTVSGSQAVQPIHSSAALFANAYPRFEIQSGDVNWDSYEELMTFRHSGAINTASNRRLGFLLKLSNEADANESAKSGGMLLESSQTYANFPSLSFVTGNVRRMTIDSSGYVGIGTTTPTTALEVNGAVKATSFIGPLTSSGTSNSSSYTLNTDTDSAGNDGGVNLQVRGTTKLLIDNSGNVGIGTTATATQLSNNNTNTVDAGNSGHTTTSIDWSASNTGYVATFFNASSVASANGLLVKGAGTNATNSLLSIDSGSVAGTPGSALFRVLGNGNIGIGTTSPNYALTLSVPNVPSFSNGISVNGYDNGGGITAGAYRAFGMRGTPASPSALQLGDGLGNITASGYWTGKTDPYFINNDGRANINFVATENWTSSANNGSAISFATTQNGTAAQVERMRIDHSGNVGIGTATPGSYLHIAGKFSDRSVDPSLWLQNTTASTGRTWQFTSGDGGLMRVRDVTAAADRLTVDTTGNVGIGTTSPYWKLTSAGGSQSILATTTDFVGGSTGSSLGLYVNGNTGNAASVIQATLNGGTSPTYLLLNPNGGNVAIGTTTPNAPLAVVSTSGSSPKAFMMQIAQSTTTGVNTDDNALVSWYHNNGSNLRQWYAGIGSNSLFGHPDNFGFYDQTAARTVMVLRAGGNVGIDTALPGVLLANSAYVLNDQASNTTTAKGLNWIAGANGYVATLGNTGTGTTANGLLVATTGTASTNRILNLTSNAIDVFTVTGAGNVGIGISAPSERLHVVGNLRVQGSTDCTLGNGAGGTNCSSDIRLKNDVTEISHALEKILTLRGVEFNWNEKSQSPGRHDIGVIAQDVEKVFPTAVMEDAHTGYKKVDYAVLVAPVIQALKELSVRVQSLFDVSREQFEAIEKLQAEVLRLKAFDEYRAREIAALKDKAEADKQEMLKENAAKTKELEEVKIRLDRIEHALNTK